MSDYTVNSLHYDKHAGFQKCDGPLSLNSSDEADKVKHCKLLK